MSSLASSTAEQEQIFRVTQKEPRDGSRNEPLRSQWRVSLHSHNPDIALRASMGVLYGNLVLGPLCNQTRYKRRLKTLCSFSLIQ